MTREGIYKIRRFIGQATWIKNRHFYTKEERHQLDEYFVAVAANWGLRMSRKDYEKEVLDKPKKEDGTAYTLNDWLLENEGITFNQYVQEKGQEWLKRFDN